MRKLIVMRGVPGSGKSTEAARLRDMAVADGQTSIVHSTDDYFIVDGVYVYNQDDIASNHKKNQKAAHMSMKDGVNVVIIDNTNTTAKEIFPYVEMAFNQDYEVEFVEPKSPWWLSASNALLGKRSDDRLRPHARIFAKRNAHNVPEFAIMKMLSRYQCGLTLEEVISTGRS